MHIHDFARNAAAAVNDHNVEAILALWAEPATYDSPLTGRQHGLAALRQREQELFDGFSDLQAHIEPLGQEGDRGAMLVTFTGTHDGTYGGLGPTGRAIELEMVAIVTFDVAGAVIAERVVLDSAQALAQLS